MSTIKKDYEELYAILEANANKKVSSIMPQLVELMSRKSGGSGMASTFTKRDGEVFEVYCYYHKKWEQVSEVEYGPKKGTATGLNTMCKEGVNQWSKQQRDKKKAESELLTKVMTGELALENIEQAKVEIAEQAKLIVPRVDGKGSDAPAV